MTAYAVLDGGIVVGERVISDWESYPSYKKNAADERGDGGPVLRPIVGTAPDYNSKTHTLTGPILQIEPTRVLRVWQVTPRDLAEVKSRLKTRISNDAETARARYLTPGSGKAMSYQQVASEAVRFQATGGAGEYPFLAARVASGRYADLTTAAAGTIAIEAQWAAIGAEIDRIEDAAKLAIDAATTVEQVQAAVPGVWP